MAAQSGPWVYYKVQSGDTWFSISRAYNVPFDELRSENAAARGTLEEGQLIFLPVKNSDNYFSNAEIDTLYAQSRECEINDSLNGLLITNIRKQISEYKILARQDSVLLKYNRDEMGLLKRQIDIIAHIKKRCAISS